MVIKNFRHSMLNYYYLIGQLVVPLGSTFYFPPMLNYFNFGRIWLTGGAVLTFLNSLLKTSLLVNKNLTTFHNQANRALYFDVSGVNPSSEMTNNVWNTRQ